MEIGCLRVGQLQTNCYLVSCLKTKEAVVIDPGDDGDFIGRKILDLKLKPKLILATHGHFDHLLAVTELKLAFKIPFLIHKDDLFLLKRVKRTAEHFLGFPADPVPTGDQYFKEGDVITFGEEKLKVIGTPGHTPGGVSFYGSTGSPRVGVLFSGDTLFCQGVGRTDFSYFQSSAKETRFSSEARGSYCSREELMKSLQKLFKLPDKTVVYPGHGSETNLAAEKSVYPKLA